jgi:ABC-type multidrug transport system permease subunit
MQVKEEGGDMSRAVIRKVFVTGLVVWVVGGILAVLTMKGGQAPSNGIYAAGLALVGIGGLIDVVSWIMALISSAILGRWGWFVVLLILGLIGLLLIVMIVYSVVGPTQPRVRRQMATG